MALVGCAVDTFGGRTGKKRIIMGVIRGDMKGLYLLIGWTDILPNIVRKRKRRQG